MFIRLRRVRYSDELLNLDTIVSINLVGSRIYFEPLTERHTITLQFLPGKSEEAFDYIAAQIHKARFLKVGSAAPAIDVRPFQETPAPGEPDDDRFHDAVC